MINNLAEQVNSLAPLLFTPSEVALMLELDPTFLQEGGQYYLDYMKGRLQSEVDLRTAIVKLAKSGSSPAQNLMIDLLRKSEAKLISNG